MEAVKMTLSIFSRQQKIRLLPFVISTIFFLLQPYEQSSVIGAFFKIIPIISLIGYVIVTRSQFPRKTKTINAETLIPEDIYSFCVMFGLCVSLIGDLLVACPYLIVPGGFLFMIVHLVYFTAIEVSGRHKGCSSSFAWLFVLLFLNTWLCTQANIDSYFLKILVLLYYVPLFLAGWKACAAAEDSPDDKAIMMACVGASCFMLSDFLVIMDHTGFPIPFAEFLYMLTYFGAQFGWAVSTSTL